uniref:Uncharacterized protein n=1 Tax=Dulem virus 38 TaxID=3145756 RepID=A0AAU8B339_9CAUD
MVGGQGEVLLQHDGSLGGAGRRSGGGVGGEAGDGLVGRRRAGGQVERGRCGVVLRVGGGRGALGDPRRGGRSPGRRGGADLVVYVRAPARLRGRARLGSGLRGLLGVGGSAAVGRRAVGAGRRGRVVEAGLPGVADAVEREGVAGPEEGRHEGRADEELHERGVPGGQAAGAEQAAGAPHVLDRALVPALNRPDGLVGRPDGRLRAGCGTGRAGGSCVAHASSVCVHTPPCKPSDDRRPTADPVPEGGSPPIGVSDGSRAIGREGWGLTPL